MTDLLNDDTCPAGSTARSAPSSSDGIGKVFSANPTAHLYMEGGFVGGIALADVNPDLEPGKTIDFFPFPTIDEAQGNPLVGGGDVTAAFVNNEDVAKLIEYLASPEAGADLGLDGRDRLAEQGRAGGRVPERAGQEGGRAGRDAEAFVFDGSDLLPGALGEDWGTLLQNVLKDPSSMDSQLDPFQQQAEDAFGG